MASNDSKVMTLAEAREELPRLCAVYARGEGDPVVVGARRVPEAVIMPYARYLQLTAAMRVLVLRDALGSAAASDLVPRPQIDAILADWLRAAIDTDTMRARVRAVYDDRPSTPV